MLRASSLTTVVTFWITNPLAPAYYAQQDMATPMRV